MLNYIWVFLLVAALACASFYDGRDHLKKTYGTGVPIPVALSAELATPLAHNQSVPVTITVSPDEYATFFGKTIESPVILSGTATAIDGGYGLKIKRGSMPAQLEAIFAAKQTDDTLAARLKVDSDGRALLSLPTVKLVKLSAVGLFAMSAAKDGVTLALGLIGTLGLWLGLMRIAEKAGLIEKLVTLVRPVLRPLFPGIPRDHPALGLVALNLSANMLGLGNAATPFGIKAMEELQKLNRVPDTATNAMVMLLALNTAGVQLMPSASLMAIMGFEATTIFFPMLVVTAMCAVVAIVAVFTLGALPGFKRSDPDLAPASPTTL